jgi:hypothetical protein
MPQYSATREGLRYCLRPEYARLPEEDLDRIIESSISGLPGDAGEDFLSTLSSVGKAVLPALQKAAPDVASGAASGAALGPWGAVIGAGAGLASSLLKSQAKPRPSTPAPAAPAPPSPAAAAPAAAPAAAVPASPSAPAAAASAPTPAPAVSTASAPAAPPALPTGQGAAATLLSLFQNPTVQQAVLSQVLGAAGSQEVPTAAGKNVPRGAINALLGQLLAKASDGLPEADSISEGYLQDETGKYLIDPASFEQQAALVLSYLRHKSPEEAQEPMEWIGESFSDIDSEEWPAVDEISEAVAFY